MNVPSLCRHGKILFLIASIIIVAAFLLFSNSLAKGVAEQERIRMQIWADATRQIASAETSAAGDASGSNLDFLLEIIETNTSIPVILTDDAGKILMQRNFDLPETAVGPDSLYISPANAIFLAGKLYAAASLLPGFAPSASPQHLSIHNDSHDGGICGDSVLRCIIIEAG